MKSIWRVGLLVGMWISYPAVASVDEWTRLGMAPGGYASSLAVAPSQPNVVYASASNGLYRSPDGGGSWKQVYERDMTGTVAVHPADANTVYLLVGREWHFILSRDGGATWQEPSPTFNAFGARLVTTPAEPDAIYAQYLIGLSKSTDFGKTWVHLTSAPGLPSSFSILDLEADPFRSGRLYLLVTDHNVPGVRGFTSTTGGMTWTEFPLPPGQVRDLAIDPTQAGSLLVVNSTSSVWRTSNFGQRWRRLSQGVLPSGLDEVWVGGGESPAILVGNQSRHFVSRDGGRSFDEISSRFTQPPLTFAFHHRRSNVFYAGLDNGGVVRTDDGGATFGGNTLVAGGLLSITASHEEPGLLYGIKGSAFLRSHDGGQSWLDLGFIAPESARLSGGKARLYESGPTVLVGTFGGVGLSRDRGQTWTFPCPSCGPVWAFLTTPADPDLIFALHPPEASGSWRSTDGGESWEEVDFSPSALSSADAQLMLRRLRGTTGERLERSSDGGASWSDASAGLPEPLYMIHLLPHPLDGELFWAATHDGLYKSTDAGASWTRVWFESGGADDVAFLGLDPTDPNTVLFLAREDGAHPDSDHSRFFSSRDGGTTWHSTGGLELPFAPGLLTGDPHHPGTFFTVNALGQPWSLTLSSPSTCVPDTTTHCLNNGRFRVKATWRDFQGGSGVGQTRALTDDTGAFWFFRPENLEVAVKALDGSGVNGHFWVFYGALSNVEYSLDVVDTQTGEARTYWNPPRNLASRGDTLAFEAGTSPLSATPASTVIPSPRGACTAGPTVLCLQGGRFRAEVEWWDFQGGNGVGQATALSSDTGSFWFFNDRNVELLVKVLDGRPVNGRFWVFYGALSNVGYTLRLTDTETGEVRSYENPAGRFGSQADTTAF